MTHPSLTLDSVSHRLPNGTTLFTDLHGTFDPRRTGLVGRNGIGKSVLAQILAGQMAPFAGRCLRSCRVHYLPQVALAPAGSTVASLAGIEHVLNALTRIEAGSTDPADFDTVGDRWDIRSQLHAWLTQEGLGHLSASTPAGMLSGGETMRVRLISALLSDADYLILDEPTNHLDRPSRHALIDQLKRWPHGLLVISHDRQLLGIMDRIVELSSLGLRSYGGNYTAYVQAKTQEQEQALELLDQRKHEQQRMQRTLQEEHLRQARRQARGSRQAQDANQARILLGRQKARSETSAGRLRHRHDAVHQQLAQQVREAAMQVRQDMPITVLAPDVNLAARQRIACLDAVELPFVQGATRLVSLTVRGPRRIGVVGPNGCGKSTLLKVMAGLLAPVGGRCDVIARSVYLDQTLATLDPDLTVLDQLRHANPMADAPMLRMRLAQLGLEARHLEVPSRSLSGGERLKAALACIVYANPAPHCLLLDEPSNHLDLASLEALQVLLRAYRGALIVVSHDDAFMDTLALDDRLQAGDSGWQLEPWTITRCLSTP